MIMHDAEPVKVKAKKTISPEAAERVVAAILHLGQSRETMFDYDFDSFLLLVRP